MNLFSRLFLLRLFALLLIAACAISARANTPFHSKKEAHGAHPKAAKKKAKRPPDEGPRYASRLDAMRVADEMAQRAQLDPHWVRHAIGQARLIPSIVRASSPPAVGTPKNWAVYRTRFIDNTRIKAGVAFWQANRDTLERAQAQTGVPAHIIVGVVGVETIYGQQVGTYRVIDALCTLAFDFPQVHPKAKARAAFFLNELEEYLKLTQRTKTDPLALRGSYAGAMGLPQFMPSSWNKYAVDFDGDNRVDLFHSPADVIGSVANYFKAFRWQPGMPTHYPMQFNMQQLDMAGLMAPDIVPTFTPTAFAAKGGELQGAAREHAGMLALVELQNGADAPLYLAGTENFYAITRYNWSSYYALAVIELGQEVAAAVAAADLANVPK